jgi:hypothetical protein
VVHPVAAPLDMYMGTATDNDAAECPGFRITRTADDASDSVLLKFEPIKSQ